MFFKTFHWLFHAKALRTERQMERLQKLYALTVCIIPTKRTVQSQNVIDLTRRI